MTECEVCQPHPEDLAEQDGVDGIDGAVDGSSQRAHQHVRPFWSVVLEDAGHWGGLHAITCFLLIFLLVVNS